MLQLSGNVELSNSVEVMHGVGKAIFGSFLVCEACSAGAHLQNRHFRAIGVGWRMLQNSERQARKNQLVRAERCVLTVISGYIPVAETFGLSKELRSSHFGSSFLADVLDHWEQVPEKLGLKIITEIRNRKGLPSKFLQRSGFWRMSSLAAGSDVPFDLDVTLCCGQVFRWDKVGDWWYGVAGNRVFKVRQLAA